MAEDHRIILLTMVKNESRIIERLMNSVKGKVDAIVVCDTGSTDDTIEKVGAWFAANDLSGAVYEYPFKNFGASRTQSFLSCLLAGARDHLRLPCSSHREILHQ